MGILESTLESLQVRGRDGACSHCLGGGRMAEGKAYSELLSCAAEEAEPGRWRHGMLDLRKRSSSRASESDLYLVQYSARDIFNMKHPQSLIIKRQKLRKEVLSVYNSYTHDRQVDINAH